MVDSRERPALELAVALAPVLLASVHQRVATVVAVVLMMVVLEKMKEWFQEEEMREETLLKVMKQVSRVVGIVE